MRSRVIQCLVCGQAGLFSAEKGLAKGWVMDFVVPHGPTVACCPKHADTHRAMVRKVLTDLSSAKLVTMKGETAVGNSMANREE